MTSSSTAAEKPYQVLLAPVITEKATTLAAGQGSAGFAYVFEVARDATKPQIRRAVEKIFEVKVTSVRVANLKGKERSLRHRSGRLRSGRVPLRRRAYVSLQDGQSIDFWSFTGRSGT